MAAAQLRPHRPPPPPPAPNVISPTTTPTARPTLPWVAGVVITVTSQWVVDADFADKSAHVVPWVKFSSTLLYALVSRRSAPTPQPTARQLRLMGLVGLLDAAAYTTYCVGFYICGATLSGILLPGLSQVLTATATRFVLGRHLSRGQALGISCVLAGLATRALPPELFGQTSTAGAAGVASKAAGSAEEREQLLGAGLIALSAVLYSGLGIAYDKLVRGAGEKPPAHADVMWHTSKLGQKSWLFEGFLVFWGAGGGARADSGGPKHWGVTRCRPAAAAISVLTHIMRFDCRVSGRLSLPASLHAAALRGAGWPAHGCQRGASPDHCVPALPSGGLGQPPHFCSGG